MADQVLSIGIDLDGVTLNTPAYGVELLRRRHGIDVPMRFYRRDRIQEVAGITEANFAAMKQRLYRERWPIELMPGALHHICMLRDAHGHTLKFVTSRSGVLLDRARELLAKHPLNDIPVVGVGRDVPKTDATTGMDVFIDDDVHKLEPLVDVPHRILFSHPYNEDDELPEGIVRLSGWAEIYQYIGKFSRGGSE